MDLDIGGALQGFSRSASGLIDRQMAEEAEVRAADRRLNDTLRLEAAREMQKNRAAERFSAVARRKAGEEIPMDAAPTTATTAASGQAIGLKEGFTGDIAQQRALLERIKDPTERAEAIAQLDAQVKAQQSIDGQANAGKMRKRSTLESARAALEETMLNDPAAFQAGQGMIHAASKDDLEERKLASKEKIEQARLDQKDRSDDKRFDAMMARIENGVGGGKGGNSTALMQNAEYLKSLGYSADEIKNFIFDKKQMSLDDLAAKILAGDKYGEMTPEQAAQKAVQLRGSLDKLTAGGKKDPGAPAPTPSPRRLDALPPGAKKVGTSGGKTVYEVNGNRFIQE
jgi:hypothetical protein